MRGSVLWGALVGALALGGFSFLAVFMLSLADASTFHGPPAWLVAALYALGGAAIGLIVGGIVGVVVGSLRYENPDDVQP